MKKNIIPPPPPSGAKDAMKTSPNMVKVGDKVYFIEIPTKYDTGFDGDYRLSWKVDTVKSITPSATGKRVIVEFENGGKQTARDGAGLGWNTSFSNYTAKDIKRYSEKAGWK